MENEKQNVSEEIVEPTPAKPRKNIVKIILFSVLEAAVIAVTILIMAGGFKSYCVSTAIPYDGTVAFNTNMTLGDKEYPAGTEFKVKNLTLYGGVYIIDPETGSVAASHTSAATAVNSDDLINTIEQFKADEDRASMVKSAVVSLITIIIATGIFFAINFKLKTRGMLIVLAITASICLLQAIFLNGSARAKAPIVYLYPEEETEVNVMLDLDGSLTSSYPLYDEGKGWTVKAAPDGTITDSKGHEYPYLFWEGDLKIKPDLTRGYCISGKDTAEFLESALGQLGLNDKEASEFIAFWLPQMQDNRYNVITFQTYAYEEAASMDINPSPDTVIRVNMLWYPTLSYVDMEPQDLGSLNPAKRSGFTVVEWGGEKYDAGSFLAFFN